MPHTHITLRVKVIELETIIDEEHIPVVANIGKVTHFFVEDLPQEVQQLFVQQFTAFLEHICEAGDEANLIREYLGNCFIGGDDSGDLLVKALGALTSKDLLIKDLLIRESLESVLKWVTAVVSAINEPYITKLVIATILSNGEKPDNDKKLRKLYLSLL